MMEWQRKTHKKRGLSHQFPDFTQTSLNGRIGGVEHRLHSQGTVENCSPAPPFGGQTLANIFDRWSSPPLERDGQGPQRRWETVPPLQLPEPEGKEGGKRSTQPQPDHQRVGHQPWSPKGQTRHQATWGHGQPDRYETRPWPMIARI